MAAITRKSPMSARTGRVNCPKCAGAAARHQSRCGIAVRIAAKDEADLDIVRGYQAQMSLTPLSEWKDGPSGKLATPPVPRVRNRYEGDFA